MQLCITNINSRIISRLTLDKYVEETCYFILHKLIDLKPVNYYITVDYIPMPLTAPSTPCSVCPFTHVEYHEHRDELREAECDSELEGREGRDHGRAALLDDVRDAADVHVPGKGKKGEGEVHWSHSTNLNSRIPLSFLRRHMDLMLLKKCEIRNFTSTKDRLIRVNGDHT